MLRESYIIHLFYVIKIELGNTSSQPTTLTTQLEGVCSRVVRNYPYSETLFTLKLEAIEKNSEIEISTFEPDDYIREACLNLHIFRNYPYSEKLFTLKLKAIEKVSEIEISTFELEAIR